MDATVERALRAISAGRRPGDLETQRLDFKRQGRSRDDVMRDVADAVLCFANAAGGFLVIGVRDGDAGSAAFEGTDLDVARLRKRVYDLTVPPLLVDVRPVDWEGVRLLVISVPEGAEVHADPEGRAPERVGTDCMPMSPARQARVRAERLGLDWAAEPSEHGLADVSPSAMEVARSRLSLLPDDRRLLASASDEDLLRGLGVLLADGRLTRAGALLCCRDVEGRNATLVYQYRATQSGEPRLVERRGPPLLTAFTRVMELVTARLNTAPLQLPGGQRVDLEDFPREAVREGLANAVLHRDYLVDDPVTVEHSPETLVITSPGPLVSGVTPDNILTHPSKPRNPAMARALRTLGLAEETGRGVDRIYREVIRSGKDEPHIDATFERVRLPLVGGAPSTRIARLLATLPQRERDDVDTMLVLLRLRDRRTTTAKALAPVLQKSTAEAEVVLRRLAGEDVALVEPTRATARRAHPSYQLRSRVVQQLGPAISYHRRSPDDIDRKVVAHVREYGRITNRTIRDLFDVDVYRARTLLADLVRREILTPPERRGPGVTYEAGPKFPKR